jgi:hypothetical protein
MQQAKAAAVDPEILRRVELADLALLYVQLYQDYDVALRGGPIPHPEVFNARLAEFERLAHQNNIAFLAEGPPNTDVWIAKLRHVLNGNQTAAIQWPATTPQGAVRVVRLPAQWKLAMDPGNVGVAQGWFAVARDDQTWAPVRTDLDCGWEAQGFAGDASLGYGWYRQRLAVPADLTQKHLYLYFGAVDEDAWVYLDGKLALDHSCQATGLRPDQIWTTPFFFDAAPYLKAGQTSLVAVRVNNTGGMGGIWKPVYLIASDAELNLASLQAAAQQEPAGQP